MASIGDLVAFLKLDASGFKQESEHASRIAEQTADKIKDAFRDTLSALGLGFGIEKFIEGIKGQIEGITELTHLADRTGIAVDKLRALQYEAKRTGTDFETLQGAIKKMQVNLGQAVEQGKGGEKRSVFEKMGLNPDQLAAMDPSEAFAKIGDAIRGIENPTLRVRAAFDIFGKTGAEALNAIEAGTKGLANAQNKVGTLDPEMIEEIHRAHDGMLDLDAATAKLSLTMAADLAPSIATVTGMLDGQIKKLTEIMEHKKAYDDELREHGTGENKETATGKTHHAKSMLDYLYGPGGKDLIQSADDIPMVDPKHRGLTDFEKHQEEAKKKANLAKAAIDEEKRRAKEAESDQNYSAHLDHIGKIEESFRTPLDRAKDQLKEVYDAWIANETGVETYAAALAKVQEEQDKLSGVKKLAEEAKRIWEETRTPLEKYQQQIEEVDKLVKAHQMNQDTANRAKDKFKQDYMDKTANHEKQKGGERLEAFSTQSRDFQQSLAEAMRGGGDDDVKQIQQQQLKALNTIAAKVDQNNDEDEVVDLTGMHTV